MTAEGDAKAAGERTAIVAGYGKLPKTTSAEQVHQVLALVALVDLQTSEVLEASTTLLVPVADRFVCDLLRGQNLRIDDGNFVNSIAERYHGNAKRAITAAYRDLIKRYEEISAPA